MGEMDSKIYGKNQSDILRAAGAITYTKVADAVGVAPSTITRFFNGEGGMKFEDVLTLLTVCNLRVVAEEGDVVTIAKDKAKSLHMLAMAGLQRSLAELEGED